MLCSALLYPQGKTVNNAKANMAEKSPCRNFPTKYGLQERSVSNTNIRL